MYSLISHLRFSLERLLKAAALVSVPTWMTLFLGRTHVQTGIKSVVSLDHKHSVCQNFNMSLAGSSPNSQSFCWKTCHLHAKTLLSAPLRANRKWKYCILQLRNVGRRVMFPTSFLDYFSSSISGHVPSLPSWPSFPLFALYAAYSPSAPHLNPLSWQKSFLLYTSSKSKGILGFFTWLVSHMSSKLARKSLSNLTQAKPF